ncbi:hypothetical protein WA1_40210 [Scytonema hofmannii PCC 7110]|uniref:Uncharacterized protein n=1 Tax=Scytonema hofmannii PCC 7110 TaxID=128403 RepID=A0A139WU54_9CYAN|nr:hypothetical protein WA1_40210 [Scytonema hofmannii PCC 7110]
MNMSDERGSGRLHCEILESATQDFTNKIEAVISATGTVQQALNTRFTGFLNQLAYLTSSTDILQMWVETPLPFANISV